jgi:tetratricopeptide (TPR) repeat protein
LKTFERTLKIREAVSDAADTDIAQSHNNIATAHKLLGNIREALDSNNKALDLRIKSCGHEQPLTAASLNNIAGIYMNGDLLDEAMVFYTDALKIYEKTFAEIKDHPELASVYNNFASALMKKGGIEKAHTYYALARDMRISIYGEKHPDTLSSQNNIAYVYGTRGDYEKALELHYDIVRNKLVMFGENLSTAKSYNNIGACHYRLSNFDEAVKWFADSLKIHGDLLGITNYETMDVENNLRIAYAGAQKNTPNNCRSSYDEWLDRLLYAEDIDGDFDGKGRENRLARIMYGADVGIFPHGNRYKGRN